MKRAFKILVIFSAAFLGWLLGAGLEKVAGDAASLATRDQANVDWAQWGGDSHRNNSPVGYDIPTEWEVGEFDYRTGEWDPTKAENIKWVAKLGSQTYGNAVVSGGKVFVGTNNSGGWLERYPSNVDLGCMIAYDLETGDFLWQHSSEKLTHRACPRLASARHLLRSVRRGQSTLVCHQQGRSPLSRHRGFSR